jgi:hypothetical protein
MLLMCYGPGEIYKQKPNATLGMGNSPGAFHSQVGSNAICSLLHVMRKGAHNIIEAWKRRDLQATAGWDSGTGQQPWLLPQPGAVV